MSLRTLNRKEISATHVGTWVVLLGLAMNCEVLDHLIGQTCTLSCRISKLDISGHLVNAV